MEAKWRVVGGGTRLRKGEREEEGVDNCDSFDEANASTHDLI